MYTLDYLYFRTSYLAQFVLYQRNLFALCCYNIQYCANLKTFNTPVKVKLF
ncbi:hypothetical protein Holit_03424 [Hollandina sp. SP2]